MVVIYYVCVSLIVFFQNKKNRLVIEFGVIQLYKNFSNRTSRTNYFLINLLFHKYISTKFNSPLLIVAYTHAEKLFDDLLLPLKCVIFTFKIFTLVHNLVIWMCRSIFDVNIDVRMSALQKSLTTILLILLLWARITTITTTITTSTTTSTTTVKIVVQILTVLIQTLSLRHIRLKRCLITTFYLSMLVSFSHRAEIVFDKISSLEEAIYYQLYPWALYNIMLSLSKILVQPLLYLCSKSVYTFYFRLFELF